ncbi:hypothetical protein SAMN04489761_2805 [Tenacibaculum sp. MAR_2009_124]|uniref:hypothetical protein n=1 Tax=Tenacibaculum sp. MAR_2009_124 TaxID=1250059 RepID=UPI00089B5F5B|nr:hypothetical protein [Tenacibaculum sp. MAR_2009_124]SEC37134.1 hypothetical protein SAMN04489761_2805 [Tenacibaculum sp. MAR_2009_124]
MKLLNIPEGGIEKVKMSQIQNLETMGYLTKVAKEKGITDFTNLNVLEAPSMNYVKTTMLQAGYNLDEANIVFTDITQFFKIKELKSFGFNISEDFMKKYNLGLDDELLINFNIEIKTKNLKKQ